MDDLQEVLNKLNDLCSFLDLVSLILSIQSSQILRKKANSNKEKTSENILLIAVFLSVCSNFIELSAAKKAYDDLSNKPDANPQNLSAASDLLISRLYSTIGAIYLLRATLKAQSSETLSIITPL
ncbi:MAG TPA: hypothetical protein VIK84_03240 [Haloplasmataceae bacterium]